MNYEIIYWLEPLRMLRGSLEFPHRDPYFPSTSQSLFHTEDHTMLLVVHE